MFMDNISGNANWTSDQDLANKKVSKKTIKEKIAKPKMSEATIINRLDDITIKSKELYIAIKNEYNTINKKKLYDALVTMQSVIEILDDI